MAKIRRKRTMTAEQKAAAVERLAKARAKRLKDNPPKYTSINSEVRSLPDDAVLSLKNVREWIKSNKDKLAAEKRKQRLAGSGDTSRKREIDRKVNQISGYISNMESYLRSGLWMDLFYGEHQDNLMKFAVTKPSHLAYNEDGTVNRRVGVWYCDINDEWTQEMEERSSHARK